MDLTVYLNLTENAKRSTPVSGLIAKMFVKLIEHATSEESIPYLVEFRDKLASIKSTSQEAGFGWYPYDTLSNWWLFRAMWGEDFARLQRVLRHRDILDVGCGDGDLSFFLESLGCDVTAVDHPRYNFNHMKGIRTLKTLLHSAVRILDIDLDSEAPLNLPENDYGLVLFLGLLYHLKNPFSALEKLGRRARFCLLSTRIAAVTPRGMPMQGESLAYLLDSREANGDPTNYWIFSETGLLRLLQRSAWEVRASAKFGCLAGSNPSSNDADERMFLILRSKRKSAPAKLTLLEGWWPIEEAGWRWVNKKFSIEMLLEELEGAPQIELSISIPIPPGTDLTVTMECQINGVPLRPITWESFGDQTYLSDIPESISRNGPMKIIFSILHTYVYPGDTRDLGVIVKCTGDIIGTNLPLDLWIA